MTSTGRRLRMKVRAKMSLTMLKMMTTSKRTVELI